MVDLGGGKKSTSEKMLKKILHRVSKILRRFQKMPSYAKKSALKSSWLPSPMTPTAKITALRVDDRLIHGQVAMTWTKQLAVQGIVVANDEAANDNTQKMA